VKPPVRKAEHVAENHTHTVGPVARWCDVTREAALIAARIKLRPERRRILTAAVKRGDVDGFMPWPLVELAERLKLDPGTVRRAFADFRARGWIQNTGDRKRPRWRYDLAALAAAAGVPNPCPRHDLTAHFEPVLPRTSARSLPRTSDDLPAHFAPEFVLDTVLASKTNYEPDAHARGPATSADPLTPAENRDRIAALKQSIRPAPAAPEGPAPDPPPPRARNPEGARQSARAKHARRMAEEASR
jgi:hypothetical protein